MPMDENQIETWLALYSKRSLALGGGPTSLVCWPGHWAVTTGGGHKSFRGNGRTAQEAFEEFGRSIADAEERETKLSETLGVSS